MNNFAPKFKDQVKELLKSMGATIMGVKPAELKSIKPRREDYKVWRSCEKQISSISQLQMIIINETSKRKKILIYHSQALDEWLDRPQILKVLTGCNYPDEYSLEQYINCLVGRLRDYEEKKAEFPHEIGIFLGYPLKDVLGFMGATNLELACKRTWKIYGKQAVSVVREQEFAAAKADFASKIEQLDIDKLAKLL